MVEGMGTTKMAEAKKRPKARASRQSPEILAGGSLTVENSEKRSTFSTSDQLVAVALDAWEQRGYAVISARAIALSAGQPISSIYYHFGDLERLLIASQVCALELAEAWCTRRIEMLPDAIEPIEGMAPLMAALIQDWSIGNRRLAFAWRECQLLAARKPDYMPVLRRWNALWDTFWQTVCDRCAIADLARINRFMFDGESFLHLIRSDPVVDGACLIELCQGWGDWLAGRPAKEGPWRRHARLGAGKASQPELALKGPVAEQIAAAAADLVTREGPASLTHRAVAAEAGLTLGGVSYHFRTSTELMQIAFEKVYRRVMGPGIEPVPATIRSRRELDDFHQGEGRAQEPHDIEMSRVAMHELIVAVARDDALKGYAAQLRYLRGRTARNFLAVLFGREDGGSPLEAALLSNIVLGRDRAYIAMERDERDLDRIDGLLLATRQTARNK